MSLPESFTIYSITTVIDGTTYYVQPSTTSSDGSQLTLTATQATPGDSQQNWVFVQDVSSSANYMIVNAASGFCAETPTTSPTDGNVVQQSTWSQTTNQAWNLLQNSNGTFQICSAGTPEAWYASANSLLITVYQNSSVTTPLNFSLVQTVNSYCCDLGFDWYAANASSTTTTANLQANLLAKPYNNPAWWTQFEQGDTIFFTLYDITTLNNPNNPNRSSVSNPSFNFSMTFTSPDSTSPLTPLTPTPYTTSTAASGGLWNSIDFGDSLPAYSVGSTNPTIPFPYTFQTSGQFQFSCTLSVTDSEGVTNNYSFDPEMIVGPST